MPHGGNGEGGGGARSEDSGMKEDRALIWVSLMQCTVNS